MQHRDARRARNGLIAGAIAAAAAGAAQADADLTIEVGGPLLEYGGVVVVYPIPVPAETWAEAAGDSDNRIRLEERYAEIQLRYPEDGSFTYRFRPDEDVEGAEAGGTQVLSVIGTDMEGRGPRMRGGFEDAYSSGGRVIRVPPLAELAAEGATRTNARWGVTERYDAPPPADQRSARALASLVRHHHPERTPLQCEGDARVQVCAVPEDRKVELEARWWRAIAEQRLERLRHHALRRCYDSWPRPRNCETEPDSDEPAYRRARN